MAEREKALLVIDMPKDCAGCIFCIFVNYSFVCRQKYFCQISRSVPMTKPDWCPLKPMPEKPDCPPLNSESALAGWNACIDKILEGSHDG